MIFDDSTIRAGIEIYNRSPNHYFWKDTNHVIKLLNDNTAKALGHKSSDVSFAGITDYDHQCEAVELADEFRKVDDIIITTLKPFATIDLYIDSASSFEVVYVRKFPIFNHEGAVIGVEGSAVNMIDCPVTSLALMLIADDVCLINQVKGKAKQKSYHLKSTYDDFGLTPRESETLFYMIRGKTAKEIALRLKIDYRTVQKYQEKIKFRMSCQSRSQLIEKAISSGAALVLLKSLLGIGVERS